MSREVSVKKLFSSSLIILFIILLDQATKALAASNFNTVCNTGFAFGILQGILNGLIAVLVLGVVIYIFLKGSDPQKETSSQKGPTLINSIGLSLIIGGGISNIVDRLTRGCVIDFIRVPWWPSFNMADVAITVGVGILIFSMLKSFKPGLSS